MLESPIIGVIPEEKSVKEALTRRDAVVHTHPKSKVSRKYNDIAIKVLGPEAEREYNRKKKGFLDKIMDKF